MTSKAYIDEIRRKVRRYRIELSITQTDMAEMTGLSLSFIKKFENGNSISAENLFKILIVLDLADMVNNSIPDLEKSPSAYIESQKNKTKQRAHKKSADRKTNFKWGDEQ
ncbi:Helix-turn-helix [Butyrivibrio sp. YAB3001]|nr:Helix-turn-helix [Butyrivibrio sp. YAB3001]